MSKKSAKHPGAGTPALVSLDAAGVAHTVHVYEHDPASAVGYGMEAAQVLGIEPARVFKTLVTSIDGTLTVGVVPVTGQLDLKALAHAVGGKKATMAEGADAERATGYVLGGISPLGQRQRLRTVVDASALEHPTVFVSGGRRGLDVELDPADLVRLTAAVVAPIARS